jgi:ferritin-like metal-binding protein YciE
MPTTKKRSSVRAQRKSNEKSRSAKSSNGASPKKTSVPESPDQGNSQLQKLFTDSLKDIYWAEKHLIKALPKMKKKATTDALKSAIEEHLAQTEEHVKRLEKVFEICGKKAQAKKCDAMEGLSKEGDSVIEETEDGSMTRDAGIIMAAQKVEHYEIATYGSLVQFAKTLGMNKAAEILHKTLDEEKQTDEKLTEIAEWQVNPQAQQENAEENDDMSEEGTEEAEQEVDATQERQEK